jgi:hypothetical protein
MNKVLSIINSDPIEYLLKNPNQTLLAFNSEIPSAILVDKDTSLNDLIKLRDSNNYNYAIFSEKKIEPIKKESAIDIARDIIHEEEKKKPGRKAGRQPIEIDENLLREYYINQGLSQNKTANLMGIPESTLNRYILKHNIRRNANCLDPKRQEQIESAQRQMDARIHGISLSDEKPDTRAAMKTYDVVYTGEESKDDDKEGVSNGNSEC